MTLLWRLEPWAARLLLVSAAALFFLIGLRYLSDPVASSATDSIALGSIMAISRVRVGFGGLPLALSLLLFGCVVSPGRLLDGLRVLAIAVGVVAAARLVGIVVDGQATDAVRLLRIEITLLAVSLVFAVVEHARSRKMRRDAPPPRS